MSNFSSPRRPVSFRSSTLLLAALLLFAGSRRGLHAQVPGGFDPAYQQPVLDQGAQVIVVQPDKKALLGGAFTTFNGAAVNPLIRLNADGTRDTSFASSAGVLVPRENANVNTLLVQPDGKVVAAAFGTTSGTPTLTRLNADGTFDPSFSTTLPDGGVFAMAIQTDGKIVIAGDFYTVNNSARTGVARLNADGTTDTSFTPPLAPDGSGNSLLAQASALVLQPDGKIVLAGTIYTGAGSVSGMVRLNSDGSLDTTLPPVGPDRGTFQTLALQADGKIIVSGSFTSIGGVTVPNIARFSGVDGTLEPGFAAGDAFDAGFNQIVVQADGKILASNNGGGGITLVRLDPAGLVDREFAPNFLLNSSTVTALALQPDGLIVASGTLILANPQGNQPNVSVARLFSNAATVGLTTLNLVVPGTAKVWLAPNGAVDQDGYGDNLTNAEPVRATGLALTPGATLTFSAAGLVDANYGDGSRGPDGDNLFHSESAQNGVSSVMATEDSLLGVFINDSTADPTNANVPPTLDFSGSATGVSGGQDYTTLTPLLNQVFFIGDGKTSGGTTQQVTVPAGATHLVFGTMDYGFWHDNSGGFNVSVTTDGKAVTTAAGGPLGVPAKADLWLAGWPDGTVASNNADRAPAESPVLVPNLTLDPNRGLIFSVVGSLANNINAARLNPPDGGPYEGVTYYTHPAENGISGVTAPMNAMLGVFVGPYTPLFNQVASALDISFVGTGKSTYSPLIGQVFFIGDGLDANGNAQTFYPPAGATRLYLGSMDNSAFNDDLGQFNVGVSVSPVDLSNLLVDESVEASSAPGGHGTAALEGDVLTYTFSIQNTGTTDDTNVVLTDILPGGPTGIVPGQGGTVTGGSIVTWKIGTLLAGHSAIRTLQYVVQTANLAYPYQNANYFATADGLPNITGRDQPVTLIEDAVSVKVSNNVATSRPGDNVRFIYDLSDSTAVKFKKLTLTVPVPPGLIYGAAYFVDANGTALYGDVNGKPLAADPTGKFTASYNNGGTVTFTVSALSSKVDVFLAVEFQVPFSFSPTGKISLPSAQVAVDKYTAGQPVSFAVSGGPDTALSGLPADKAPAIVFTKTTVTGEQAQSVFALNAKLGPLLNATALQSYLAANPNAKTVSQLGSFTDLSQLTADQILQVLNPFLGTEADADASTPTPTLPAPNSKQPTPFVTFALAFDNFGAGKASSVTINDSVPTGLALVPGSILLNGAAIPSTALTLGGDGRSFNVTVKNIKTGSGGVILYRATVLPASAGGLAVGTSIVPTSAQMTIAGLTSEIIAPGPDPILLTGPAHAFAESSQGGRTPIGANVTYTIYYKNDGGQTISDFEVVSPVPAGGAYVSSTLLDIDQQARPPNPTKGETAPVAPAVGATTGRVVFHLGKVKVGGLGFVQVVYQMTPGVLQLPVQALYHQAYVAATGGLPATNASLEHSPILRRLMATRDINDPAGTVGAPAAQNRTATANNPNGPNLALTFKAPQSATAGEAFTYNITAVSLGGTGFGQYVGNPFATDDPAVVVIMPLPANTEFVGASNTLQYAPAANGNPATIFGTAGDLPNGGSAPVYVTLRATGAAGSTVTMPDMYIKDAFTGLTLHSGPAVTSVVAAVDDSVRLTISQNALSSVQKITVSGADYSERAGLITGDSKTTVVIGADFVSLDNDVIIIPTTPGNIVAQGGGNIVAQGGGNIVAQGGGNIVAQGGGNIVAQGGGNFISVANLNSKTGQQLIGSSGLTAAAILHGIVAQGGGNIVAQGGGNIVAQGGGNLLSAGIKVISNDGGSLTPQVIAAGPGNAEINALSFNNGGEVFSSATDSLATTGVALTLAAGGGAVEGPTAVLNTADGSTIQEITANGNLIRVGSGLFSQDGGN